MGYMITARKWRPQTFEEVIGQEHITQTLGNALLKERFSQSYLFSGPRGVGKTTLARIFAKALNCEEGPTESPCGKCEYCKEVMQNRSMHYREIDGASNRGIDQIRSLNESLQYASPKGKNRIFVIDEVHMLTIEAFNALLKSLEEPPSGVIFIFCTTVSHKIPITIRSRCQHYSFKLFDIETIEAHLERIVKKEGIEYDKQSIFYIAQAANGSMRDAQNILDQAIAYCEDTLLVNKVLEVLGKTDMVIQKEFVMALYQEDLPKNKKLLHDLLRQGKNMHYFLYELIHYFSLMVYLKAGIEERRLLEISEEEKTFLKECASHFKKEELFTLSEVVFECIKELRTTINESLMMGFFLIRLHRYKRLVTPEELKAELLSLADHVEKQEIDSLSEEEVVAMISKIEGTENGKITDLLKGLSYVKAEAETLYVSRSAASELTKEDEVKMKTFLIETINREKGHGTIKEIIIEEKKILKRNKRAKRRRSFEEEEKEEGTSDKSGESGETESGGV